MPKLLNVTLDALIGEISEDQLSFFCECLEEEGLEERDYYLIDDASLDLLDEEATSDVEKRLVDLLRKELEKSGDSLTVTYET